MHRIGGLEEQPLSRFRCLWALSPVRQMKVNKVRFAAGVVSLVLQALEGALRVSSWAATCL